MPVADSALNGPGTATGPAAEAAATPGAARSALDPAPAEPDRRGRVFEMVAAVCTAAGKFVLSDWLGYQLHFTIAAIAFWAGYVTLRHSWNPTVLKRWGFSRAGLKTGLVLGAGVFVVGLTVSLLYGLIAGSSLLNWNLGLLLLLYPVWGVVQQLLVTCLFADNVMVLSRGKVSPFVVVMMAALLFSAAHVPDRELMVATFFLGITTVLIFFRTRNLLAVGILHGWFASVFYFFGMGQDPLAPLLAATFGTP